MLENSDVRNEDDRKRNEEPENHQVKSIRKIVATMPCWSATEIYFNKIFLLISLHFFADTFFAISEYRINGLQFKWVLESFLFNLLSCKHK